MQINQGCRTARHLACFRLTLSVQLVSAKADCVQL